MEFMMFLLFGKVVGFRFVLGSTHSFATAFSGILPWNRWNDCSKEVFPTTEANEDEHVTNYSIAQLAGACVEFESHAWKFSGRITVRRPIFVGVRRASLISL
jgi:hypothetical protein